MNEQHISRVSRGVPGARGRNTGYEAIGLLAVWLAATMPSVRAEQQVLDLPSAIQLALLQNRDLRQIELAAASAEYGIEAAEAAFVPRVRPEGSAFASDIADSLVAGLGVARLFSAGTDVSVRGGYARVEQDEGSSTERTSVALAVTQPLFRNFGALINREPVVRAERSYLSTRRQLERRKSDLVLKVVQSFEGLVRIRQQIEFDRNFVERTEQLYRLTRARERQGRATRVDSLRVELQRGQAKSRLANNRERIASLQLDFADLLGFPPGTMFDLAEPPLVEWAIPAAEEAHAVAFSNRLDLAQSQQDLEDAGRGVRIAHRALLPTMRVVTRVEPYGEGDTFEESLSLEDTTWSIALEGDTELVRQRERSALNRRILDEEAAARSLEITRDAVIRDVNQALLAYQRAHRELEIAEGNMDLAAARVLLARRLFGYGRGDNFSVTDAEDALLSAQQSILLARADASFSGYRMLHSLGTLIEFPDDLKPLAMEVP